MKRICFNFQLCGGPAIVGYHTYKVIINLKKHSLPLLIGSDCTAMYFPQSILFSTKLSCCLGSLKKMSNYHHKKWSWSLKAILRVLYFNHLVCSFVASCHQVSIWGQSLYNKWHCAGLSKCCVVFVPDNWRGASKKSQVKLTTVFCIFLHVESLHTTTQPIFTVDAVMIITA